MTLALATSSIDFGVGPLAISSRDDLVALKADDRLLVSFADCELIFAVIGTARGALHLGCFVTPWEYVYWRCEKRGRTWLLSTADRAQIEALRRFYGLRTG